MSEDNNQDSDVNELSADSGNAEEDPASDKRMSLSLVSNNNDVRRSSGRAGFIVHGGDVKLIPGTRLVESVYSRDEISAALGTFETIRRAAVASIDQYGDADPTAEGSFARKVYETLSANVGSNDKSLSDDHLPPEKTTRNFDG